MDPLQAPGLGVVQLADREAVPFDVTDHPGRDDAGRRIDHAADDALGLDPGFELAVGIEAFEPAAVEFAAVFLEVPPGQAVLNGQHHGVRAVERRQLVRDRGKVVGLDRQNHQILRAGVLEGGGRGQVLGQVFRAVRPNQLEAVALDRLEVGALVDHRDLVARERQPRPEQAADGAGADDTNFHACLLSCLPSDLRGALIVRTRC